MRPHPRSRLDLRSLGEGGSPFPFGSHSFIGYTKGAPKFVLIRDPRRRDSWRGHLTQTEGRDDAPTTGEGRRERPILVKRPEPHCDLQATAAARRLKRRQPRGRCAAHSWSRRRRNAVMKRPFHLPNAPNMRISQCFQGYGLHKRPKTGDIPS